ncbi:MAG: riboflavin biosynthesis protein RibD [Planctomycetota bacterium]|nr:MAG: riboflavin biosynthesis protein RibD [Planctomycetota bacterium]
MAGGAGERAPRPEADARWLGRCLELAARGWGRVEPNPLVGAVVVREGVAVGEGWHERFGGPHAEVRALAAAGERARGATLYVSLEPCAHTGKTPPCTEAIVAAGCARVVYALADPHPEARGGAERLRAAGIACELLELPQARRLNAPFLKRLRTGMPLVVCKWAMTLDGRIATRTGDARWISGEASRRRAHQMRAQADAVLIGIGTALADDPLLTVRLPSGEPLPAGARARPPLRVVADARARLPLDSRLVQSAGAAPLVVAVSAAAPAERRERLRAAGVEVLLADDGAGGVDLAGLLRALAARGGPAPDPARRDDPAVPWPVSVVLAEGGARLHAALLEQGLADRICAFVAPKLIGGATAPGPVAGEGLARMAEARRLCQVRVERLQDDVLIEGDLDGGD